MPGTNTSRVEILNLTQQGFSLLLDGETLQLAFSDFPWFRGAALPQLREVLRPSDGHLYWPSLDVDLSLASLRDPAAFPLISQG